MKYPKFWLVFGLLISSCTTPQNPYEIKQCQNQERNHTKYQACDLSDIKDYYDVALDYLDESDKVILYLEGGPHVSTSITKIKTRIKADKDNFFDALKKEKISFLMVNEAHWLKQKKYKNGNLEKWTPLDALKENMESIKITHNVIKHLKNRGKKVLLYGWSYGAILVNEYLSKYGDDLPDFVLSTVARLKMNNTNKFINSMATAIKHPHSRIYLRKNDQIDDEANMALKHIPKGKGEKNFWKMLYEMGFKYLIKDFTKSITDTNLGNTTFVSVEPDRRVGWFNEEEINWARSRGAKVDLIRRDETKKSFLKYYYEGEEPAEKAIDWYAHIILEWDKLMVEKYFIKPFAK